MDIARMVRTGGKSPSSLIPVAALLFEHCDTASKFLFVWPRSLPSGATSDREMRKRGRPAFPMTRSGADRFAHSQPIRSHRPRGEWPVPTPNGSESRLRRCASKPQKTVKWSRMVLPAIISSAFVMLNARGFFDLDLRTGFSESGRKLLA